MSEHKSSPIPQGNSAVFYAFFILFVLICLVASGDYYLLARDLYSRQQRDFERLSERIDYNEAFNIQQNLSLTELEERVKKLEEN